MQQALTSQRLSRDDGEMRTRDTQRKAALNGETQLWTEGSDYQTVIKGMDHLPVRHLKPSMMSPKAPSLRIPDQGQGLAKASTEFMQMEIAPSGPRKPHVRRNDMAGILRKFDPRNVLMVSARVFIPWDEAEQYYKALTAKIDPARILFSFSTAASEIQGLASVAFEGKTSEPGNLRMKRKQSGGNYTFWITDSDASERFTLRGMANNILAGPAQLPQPPTAPPLPRANVDTRTKVAPVPKDIIRPAPKSKFPKTRPPQGKEAPGKPPKNGGGGSGFGEFLFVSSLVALPAAAFFLTL